MTLLPSISCSIPGIPLDCLSHVLAYLPITSHLHSFQRVSRDFCAAFSLFSRIIAKSRLSDWKDGILNTHFGDEAQKHINWIRVAYRVENVEICMLRASEMDKSLPFSPSWRLVPKYLDHCRQRLFAELFLGWSQEDLAAKYTRIMMSLTYVVGFRLDGKKQYVQLELMNPRDGSIIEISILRYHAAVFDVAQVQLRPPPYDSTITFEHIKQDSKMHVGKEHLRHLCESILGKDTENTRTLLMLYLSSIGSLSDVQTYPVGVCVLTGEDIPNETIRSIVEKRDAERIKFMRDRFLELTDGNFAHLDSKMVDFRAEAKEMFVRFQREMLSDFDERIKKRDKE